MLMELLSKDITPLKILTKTAIEKCDCRRGRDGRLDKRRAAFAGHCE